MLSEIYKPTTDNLRAINQLKKYSYDEDIKKVFLIIGTDNFQRNAIVPVLNDIPHSVLFDQKDSSRTLISSVEHAQQQQPPINLWSFKSMTQVKIKPDHKMLFINYEFEQNNEFEQISLGLIFNFLFKLFKKKIRILFLLSSSDLADAQQMIQIFKKYLFFFSQQSIESLGIITTILVTGYQSENQAISVTNDILSSIQSQLSQDQPLVSQFLQHLQQNKIVAFQLKDYKNKDQLLQKILESYDQNAIQSMSNISIDFLFKKWSQSQSLYESQQFRNTIVHYMMQFRPLIRFIKAIFDKLNNLKTYSTENLSVYDQCGIIFCYSCKERFQYSITPLKNVRQNVISCVMLLRENLKSLKNFVQQQILDFIESIMSFYSENLIFLQKSIKEQSMKTFFTTEAKDLFQFANSQICQNEQMATILKKQYQSIYKTQNDQQILEKALIIIQKTADKEDQTVVKSVHKVIRILLKAQCYEQTIQCLGYINNYVLMENLIKQGIKKQKIRIQFLRNLFCALRGVNQKDLAIKVINLLLAGAKNQEEYKSIDKQFKTVFQIRAQNKLAFTIDTQKVMKKYRQSRT